eukprot:5162141-Pyramimonas_sp.AAC.1
MLPSDVDKWATLVQGEIIAPGEPTCGARDLDFFICSRVLAPFVESVYLVSEAPAKSHAPVALKLSGIGVQVKVPRMLAPKKFPIEKPPPVRCAPLEAREDQWPWQI